MSLSSLLSFLLSFDWCALLSFFGGSAAPVETDLWWGCFWRISAFVFCEVSVCWQVVARAGQMVSESDFWLVESSGIGHLVPFFKDRLFAFCFFLLSGVVLMFGCLRCLGVGTVGFGVV